MAKKSKTATVVIITVILTILAVGLTNLGLSIFYDRPDFNDFCEPVPREVGDEPKPLEFDDTCRVEFEEAQKDYNQVRFYILSVIGFVAILVGLFVPEPITKFTGMASGGILVGEAIVLNLQNEIAAFITGIILFVLIIVFAIRQVKK